MDQIKCSTCKGQSNKGACPFCRRRLIKILKELISYIDLLNASPSLRQQVSTHQEIRGSLSNALIINVQIVDLIAKSGIQSVLEKWALHICSNRDIHKRILNRSLTKTKLHAIGHFLLVHNDWIADDKQWKEYYDEVMEPYLTLKKIIFGERKPLEKVPCPVQDCLGTLFLQQNGDVYCLADKTHEWKYEQWARLAKLTYENQGPNVQANN